MKTVWQCDDLAYPIKLKIAARGYMVAYGKQVTGGLTYEQAAAEIGRSIMHALQCDGKLD